MPKYIDADKVSKDLKELFKQYILNDNMYLDAVDTSADVQKIIHSEPDALIHAHWEQSETEEDIFECSYCGYDAYISDGTPKENEMFYCPFCGAVMDEEAK